MKKRIVLIGYDSASTRNPHAYGTFANRDEALEWLQNNPHKSHEMYAAITLNPPTTNPDLTSV